MRQLRVAVSPVSKRRPEFLVATGDADNSQLNAVRWFVDLPDGGKQIDPDSGIPGTCGTLADGHLYGGVRDGNGCYEPESGPPGGRRSTGPATAAARPRSRSAPSCERPSDATGERPIGDAIVLLGR